jgi:uncharacterized protein YajQ (UPF0234 family)
VIESKQNEYFEQASDIIKETFIKKGIVIRTEDLKDPLLKIGEIYHQMEKEDEI